MTKKNVLILISDEHNPFYTSVYGHRYIKTENMDWMAKEGTVFNNAYCSSPLCLPSRSSFMTGKKIHELQTYNNCNVNLNVDFLTYGRVLKEQGVHTVHIGKTDVYDSHWNLGFSEMILPRDRKQPGDINFSRTPLKIRENSNERADGYGIKSNPFNDDIDIVDEAIRWILEKGRILEKPWVLSVNILKPHFPHWVTKKLWDMYPEGEDLPIYNSSYETSKHPYSEDLRKHFKTDMFSETQIKGLRRGYLGCIQFVDMQIGRLKKALDESGILENTNFIYTSDHGDMVGKFGMWWKCSLYEDSVRIPCIAVGPDFKKNVRVNTPVDLLDVQASIFEAVKCKRPVDWSGIPLQNINEENTEKVVFSEYHGHGTRSGAYMIRKGNWKLIYYIKAPNQLFNLKDDPDELINLYEEFNEIAIALEEELYNICNPIEENIKAHEFERKQMKIIEEKFLKQN